MVHPFITLITFLVPQHAAPPPAPVAPVAVVTTTTTAPHAAAVAAPAPAQIPPETTTTTTTSTTIPSMCTVSYQAPAGITNPNQPGVASPAPSYGEATIPCSQVSAWEAQPGYPAGTTWTVTQGV